MVPCSGALQASINDMNTTVQTWHNMTNSTGPNGDMTKGEITQYHLFNTTDWISYNLAPGAQYCFGVVLDVWNYTSTQRSLYSDLSEMGMSFMQNLLGNSITF